MDDALGFINGSPQTASWFARAGTLITDAASWHWQHQLGTAAPTRLCSETLPEYYIHLLEEHFEPHQLRGKLLYESAQPVGRLSLDIPVGCKGTIHLRRI